MNYNDFYDIGNVVETAAESDENQQAVNGEESDIARFWWWLLPLIS